MLNLFAIRGVEKQEAVGLFWAPDLETLWWMVDTVTDPDVCEYCVIDAPAAITWPNDAPAIGVALEDLEDVDSNHEALARGVSFAYAIEDVLFGEIIKGWIRMPSAPDPREKFPRILREWGR